MAFPADGMELTHILVVDDLERARRWYEDVLGASPYREYGGAALPRQLAAARDRAREIRCFFRDPDGHLFEISQTAERPPPR